MVIYEVFCMVLVSFGVFVYVLLVDIEVNGYMFLKDVWLILGLFIINWDFFIYLELEKFNFG